MVVVALNWRYYFIKQKLNGSTKITFLIMNRDLYEYEEVLEKKYNLTAKILVVKLFYYCLLMKELFTYCILW